MDDDQLPECFYSDHPPATLIPPSGPTPRYSLYLSNLDDQKFLRFSIKYLYLFRRSVPSDALRRSLSLALLHYYPLAGRLTPSPNSDHKLELDCNALGAVFVDAFMDITADRFLHLSGKPNRSWKKLLYRLDALSFLDIPPLVIQVTNLRCGGMILCVAINHCICDGIGTSQFLNAWAHLTTHPFSDLPIAPFHSRHVLRPRSPPRPKHVHPEYTRSEPQVDIVRFLQSQPLVATSLTFTPSLILRLKRQCVPSLKCTAFEALASHTWRAWVRSLDLSPSLRVKLLFSVNVRKRVDPGLPGGFYGNGFVLGCAEGGARELAGANLRGGVRLVQEAKARIDDGYVRSMVDLLEEDKMVKTDVGASLVISQWSRLGLEDVDFGEGKAVQVGPLTSDIYCLFLPVVGDSESVRVLVSVPESVAARFEYYMTTMDFNDDEEDLICADD